MCILELVPHEHGPNKVLQIIIYDIVKCCIEVITYIDIFGRRIRIFLGSPLENTTTQQHRVIGFELLFILTGSGLGSDMKG